MFLMIRWLIFQVNVVQVGTLTLLTSSAFGRVLSMTSLLGLICEATAPVSDMVGFSVPFSNNIKHQVNEASPRRAFLPDLEN